MDLFPRKLLKTLFVAFEYSFYLLYIYFSTLVLLYSTVRGVCRTRVMMEGMVLAMCNVHTAAQAGEVFAIFGNHLDMLTTALL